MVVHGVSYANTTSMQYPQKPDDHSEANSKYIYAGNTGNEIQDLLKSFSNQITEE